MFPERRGLLFPHAGTDHLCSFVSGICHYSGIFVFGGDYSRTESLEYEDDEYFYYVKAVPKASVSTSERSIKKINGEPIREERRSEEKKAVSFTEPTQAVSDKPKETKDSTCTYAKKGKAGFKGRRYG